MIKYDHSLAKIEATELNSKTSIKLWNMIFTKQNKWTRSLEYTCTFTISSQCSCIYSYYFCTMLIHLPAFMLDIECCNLESMLSNDCTPHHHFHFVSGHGSVLGIGSPHGSEKTFPIIHDHVKDWRNLICSWRMYIV